MVAGFVGSVLSSRFDNAVNTPEFHHECWQLCCSLNKYVAIAAPRGHAKSTAITLGYGLSTLLFRERKFMLLVSDTESQSAMFLGTIKQELQDNQVLADLFDIARDEKGIINFGACGGKDTETDIIVPLKDGHKFRIIAKGAEQKMRGLIWNGTRPDIVMCDDMENDELVMNPERRNKFKRWFRSALLPCISDHGIVRVVGTILHMDSLLESFMPAMNDKYTINEELKVTTSRRTLWKAIKYRAHNPDFTSILWPEKKSAEEFKALRADAADKGMLDSYSQEYLNYPLDETTAYFKKADFLPIKELDRKLKKNYYVTVDLAISDKETADYSVFLVAGVDENKLLHVVNVIRERLDGREIVDQLIALQRMYDPQAIGIEEMQVSKSIGPFLREQMLQSNQFISLVAMKHGGKDKMTRSRSIQARMRAKGVKFDTEADWYPEFETELLQFPRSKKDDQVDAFSYLGLLLDSLIEAPTPKEEEEEMYQQEYETSGLSDAGRSQTTGY